MARVTSGHVERYAGAPARFVSFARVRLRRVRIMIRRVDAQACRRVGLLSAAGGVSGVSVTAGRAAEAAYRSASVSDACAVAGLVALWVDGFVR